MCAGRRRNENAIFCNSGWACVTDDDHRNDIHTAREEIEGCNRDKDSVDRAFVEAVAGGERTRGVHSAVVDDDDDDKRQKRARRLGFHAEFYPGRL